MLSNKRFFVVAVMSVLTCAGGGLFLGAGCKVGPDFHEPKRKMPGDWLPPTTAPTTQNASIPNPQEPADVTLWWRNFKDPQLDSLIDRAMKQNLDLQAAESRIRQARDQRAFIASGLWPQANVNAAYARQGSDGSASATVAGNQVRASRGSHDLFQSGLDASWEMDIFGGVRRDVEAAEAQIRFAIEDQRDVMVTLTSEVALNYIDLRGLQRQIQIARENLKVQEYSADLTRRRQRGGLVSALDVANADALVASTKSAIPVFEQQARQTIYDLTILLGQDPESLVNELDPAAAIPVTPLDVPIGLPSELLRRRPDIRRAEENLHAATARIGVATADLFPKFSLTGSITQSGNQFQNIWNWNNSFWSIGPGVSWPIFSAGSIRANIRVQNELQKQAAILYEQTVLTALRDVESALVAYVQEQQHHAALNDAVIYNRKAVNIAQQLYAQGQTDYLNVISAERSLFGAEDALVQSERTMATNLVALYKALGGGWETPPATTQPVTTQPVTQPTTQP